VIFPFESALQFPSFGGAGVVYRGWNFVSIIESSGDSYSFVAKYSLKNICGKIDSYGTTFTYYVFAYNKTLKDGASADPIDIVTKTPKVEIVGHEVQFDGSVKLTWNGGDSFTEFYVMNGEKRISEKLSKEMLEWIDKNPVTGMSNQYWISAAYKSGGESDWTRSNKFS
jgi:hypothetical protein